MTWMLARSAIDWGTVPAWVGAIGSAGALFLALMLLQGEIVARRREQAGAVSIWVEWPEGPSPEVIAEVVVFNAGRAAIHDCRLRIVKRDDLTSMSWRLPVLAPGQKCSETIRSRNAKGVPPGVQANFDLPEARLSFVDGHRRVWEVSSTGVWRTVRRDRR